MKYEISITTSFDAKIGEVTVEDQQRLKNKLSAAVEEIVYDFILEQIEQKTPIKVEVVHHDHSTN